MTVNAINALASCMEKPILYPEVRNMGGGGDMCLEMSGCVYFLRNSGFSVG
jgi:hypothetical protein